MIVSSKSWPHWNYLLALDSDLVVLSRYVEFTPPNFECYSLEISRLLFAAASEVDVVSKVMCRQIDPQTAADGILQYRNVIRVAYPRLVDFPVTLSRFGLLLHPWEEWTKPDGVPVWWTSYNKVKHHRDTHFAHGNLKNALNAVAGLFTLVLYLYKKEAGFGELVPSPSLLDAGEGYQGGVVIERGEPGRAYNL
jgi:hypothetical protein